MKKKITSLMALVLALCVLASGLASMAVFAVENEEPSTSSQPSAAPSEPSEPSSDPSAAPEPPADPETPEYPIITHTPVAFVPGEQFDFVAVVTDPIFVQYVQLFYRHVGFSAYSNISMEPDENNTYYISVPFENRYANGIEYYIEASNGESVTYCGTESEPIRVLPNITIDAVDLQQFNVTVPGVDATLAGNNFMPGMELTVGGISVEYTLKDSKHLTFAVPVNNMGRHDITLTFKGQSVTLPQAITYTDSASMVMLSCADKPFGGDKIRIPVIISATGKIFGADLTFKLDPTHFTDIAFEPGAGNPDAMHACNVAEDGTVTLSMTAAAGQSLMTGEAIGYITATAASLPLATDSKVEVVSAMFNAVSVGVISGCTVSIQPTFTISGTVTYFGSGAGMAGVTVTLSDGQTTVTDENGFYSFEGLKTQDLTVSVSYEGHINYAISAQDAALVLKIATDPEHGLSRLQLLAADMDGDRQFTAMDAYIILNKVVGNSGAFPSTGSDWLFVASGDTGADFIGILRGDVSGSWSQTPAEELE